MDPKQIADELRAIEGRGPCTDAERRAARAIAQRLRTLGRRPRTQTVWVRPDNDALLALASALGVAASVVSVDHARAGLSIAIAALALLVLAPLLAARRATQWVWSGGDATGVRLLLACRADAATTPLAERWLARAALPGPRLLLGLALIVLIGFTAARTGGHDSTVIGALQILPTAICIAGVGAFLDALAAKVGDAAAGPAAALAVMDALDRQPLQRLTPEVVVAEPRAMRAFVRAQRRAGTSATDVVVVELREGRAGYLRSDGALLPQRFHPRLVALMRGVDGNPPARRGRSRSPAAAARAARWPAIALEGDATELVDLALGLAAGLDRELVERQG